MDGPRFLCVVPNSSFFYFTLYHIPFKPLSAKLTKWPTTLKQFVGNLPTNCLSVFGHFVGLALKGLKSKDIIAIVFVVPISNNIGFAFLETHFIFGHCE